LKRKITPHVLPWYDAGSPYQSASPVLSKQIRLLSACLFLRFDHGDRRHIENSLAVTEGVRMCAAVTDQSRSVRPARHRQHLDQSDRRYLPHQDWHDQDVRHTFKARMRQGVLPSDLRQRGIALHFTIGFDSWMILRNSFAASRTLRDDSLS